MTTVLKYSQAHGRAKLVLLGIANHQGDEGAWPSIATLANYANASERSVKRDIQELIQMGELVVEVNAAPVGGQYRTNRYWVTIDHPGVTDQVSRDDNSGNQGCQIGSSGVTPVGTLNIINHKRNLKNYMADFENFWNAYPRKENKKAAVKVWASLVSDDLIDEVIAGAIRFANDPNLPPKQFVPHAATWLRSERWHDPALPERQKTVEELQAIKSAEAKLRRDRDVAETLKMIAEQPKHEAAPRCQHGKIVAACMKCIRAGIV
jgi:hypothetical protein